MAEQQIGDSSSSEHTSYKQNIDTPSTQDENFDFQGLRSMLPTSEVEHNVIVAEQQVGDYRPSATDGSFERYVKECHVCMEAFSNNRRPKCLPCSHKVCELCLEGMIASDLKKCTLCRAPFTATSKDGVPTDTDMEYMLQLSQDQSLVVQDTQHNYSQLTLMRKSAVSTQESLEVASTSKRTMEAAIVNLVQTGAREGVMYASSILTTTGGDHEQKEKSENKSEQTSSDGGKTESNQQQEKTLEQKKTVVKTEYISVGHDQGAITAIQAMEDKKVTHKLKLEEMKYQSKVAAEAAKAAAEQDALNPYFLNCIKSELSNYRQNNM